MHEIPRHLKTDPLGRVMIGEVERIVGCSRWTLRRKIIGGEFPPPLVAGRGAKTLWAAQDILEWVASQPGSMGILR